MFASREDAGRRLGHYLLEHDVRPEIVLGLPRGGVVVAAEVANILQTPLDVVIVRKIGHPLHREFAVGALAEPDVVVLDDSVSGRNPLIRMQLKQVIEEEQERLQRYGEIFHRDGLPDLPTNLFCWWTMAWPPGRPLKLQLKRRKERMLAGLLLQPRLLRQMRLSV